MIEKAVFDELCGLLDSGLPKEKDNQKDKEAKHTLRKGRPNVVMFVGLQVRGSLWRHAVALQGLLCVQRRCAAGGLEALWCCGDAARPGTSWRMGVRL